MAEYLLVKVGFIAASTTEEGSKDFANSLARALAGDGAVRITGFRPNEPVPDWGKRSLRFARADADVYQLESPFTARVTLAPDALSRLEPDRPKSTSPVEFVLAYDGELFATASSDLARGDVGVPCRRLLTELIEKEGHLRPFVVGPSPIHPDIHLKVTRGDEYFEVTDWQYDAARDILTVGVTTDPGHTTEEILSAFLGEVGLHLTSFYELQCSRSAIDEAYGLAVSSFEALHELEGERQKISSLRFVKSVRARRQAWALVSDVHRALAEHALRDSSFSAEYKDFLEHMKRSPWLKEVESYFERMVSSPGVRYEVLLAGVESVRSALLTSSQNRAVVWSGLVGVVLGAMLGAAIQATPLSGRQRDQPSGKAATVAASPHSEGGALVTPREMKSGTDSGTGPR